MTDISSLLAAAVTRKASDLFLTAGKKPAFRIHAEVISDPALPEVSAGGSSEKPGNSNTVPAADTTLPIRLAVRNVTVSTSFPA